MRLESIKALFVSMGKQLRLIEVAAIFIYLSLAVIAVMLFGPKLTISKLPNTVFTNLVIVVCISTTYIWFAFYYSRYIAPDYVEQRPFTAANNARIPSIFQAFKYSIIAEGIYFIPLYVIAFIARKYELIIYNPAMLGAALLVIAILFVIAYIGPKYDLADSIKLFGLAKTAVLPIICIVLGLKLLQMSTQNISELIIPVVKGGMRDIQVTSSVQKLGIFTIIFNVMLVPIYEEIIFRGILLSSIERKYGMVKAIIITSILFGLLHFSIIRFPSIFLESLIVGWLVCKSGSIYIAIILHTFHNADAVIGQLIVNNNIIKNHNLGHSHWLSTLLLFLISLIIITIGVRLLLRSHNGKVPVNEVSAAT